jgi:hypothetical protein
MGTWDQGKRCSLWPNGGQKSHVFDEVQEIALHTNTKSPVLHLLKSQAFLKLSPFWAGFR